MVRLPNPARQPQLSVRFLPTTEKTKVLTNQFGRSISVTEKFRTDVDRYRHARRKELDTMLQCTTLNGEQEEPITIRDSLAYRRDDVEERLDLIGGMTAAEIQVLRQGRQRIEGELNNVIMELENVDDELQDQIDKLQQLESARRRAQDQLSRSHKQMLVQGQIISLGDQVTMGNFPVGREYSVSENEDESLVFKRPMYE